MTRYINEIALLLTVSPASAASNEASKLTAEQTACVSTATEVI